MGKSTKNHEYPAGVSSQSQRYMYMHNHRFPLIRVGVHSTLLFSAAGPMLIRQGITILN